jgi:hypothetical protein
VILVPGFSTCMAASFDPRPDRAFRFTPLSHSESCRRCGQGQRGDKGTEHPDLLRECFLLDAFD